MRKKFEIKQWYEAQACDVCGGVFLETASNILYMTNPSAKEFKCNVCGTISVLTEDSWPQIKTFVEGVGFI